MRARPSQVGGQKKDPEPLNPKPYRVFVAGLWQALESYSRWSRARV